MNKVEFPAITIRDDMDDDTKVFAEALNWQNAQLAILGARVSEIYSVFEQLKPLMGAMPKMPAGMVAPNGMKLPGMR